MTSQLHGIPVGISAVVLDLEGTIVPIDFVHQVLFPYAAQHLERYLHTQEGSDQAQSWLGALRGEMAQEKWPNLETAPPLSPNAETLAEAAPILQWLIANDVKSPVLKAIQGRIWKQGYEKGELQGQLYPQVDQAIRHLQAQGLQLAIYSSGSVEAQKLLLRNSNQGDLTIWIQAWFDTAIGPKTDSGSYLRLADQMGLEPGKILFATDHPKEARAALDAGLAVALSLVGVATETDARDLRPELVATFKDFASWIMAG
jgi:enolase-phosphatase E1